MEGTPQHVDGGIAVWIECVTVNIMWNVLHSKWTVILLLEGRVLQWTLCGRHTTARGQWYCRLNCVCFSEHYVEGTAQQVDSIIAAWKACVSVNIMWKILHSRWIVLLQLECRVLQWTFSGRYSTTGRQWFFSLSGMCYSEHYVEDIAQQVDRNIVAWMSVLQWKLYGINCTAGEQWYCSLNGVCYIGHNMEDTISSWTVVLQIEWSVIQ